MADYEADPGYAFRQAEGMKAIERSAPADEITPLLDAVRDAANELEVVDSW